jgi:hypothetical protein
MDINPEQIWIIATSVVTIASAITAIFPAPTVSPWLILARKALNWCAINKGWATNAADEKLGR